MRTARAALALVLIANISHAEWRFVEEWTDPFNEYQTKAALSIAEDGSELRLYRNPAGRVYALMTLPDSAGMLAKSGLVATLTPEGFNSKEIESSNEQGRFIEFAKSDGRMLRDRLWHGEGSSPTFGTFHDIVKAPQVTAVFNLADGGAYKSTWSMAGAGTPIAQAIGITIDGVSAGDVWDDLAAQALLAAMTTCQFPKLDVICVQDVTTCSDKISKERDIEAFELCVAAARQQ